MDSRAIVRHEGRYVSAHLCRSLSEASAVLRDAAVLAVDMPIGLPEGCEGRADFEAKAFISRHAPTTESEPSPDEIDQPLSMGQEGIPIRTR